MKHLHLNFYSKLSLIILLVLIVQVSRSQNLNAGYAKTCNLNKSGIAIEGYDPVGYFLDQKAEEGNKEISYTYAGVKYLFANTEHRDLFKANPDKFIPQYGGWCAYAMGDSGDKVDIDPKTFKLLNGKLYLFYNKFFNNTKTTWNKNEAILKPKADANWAKISK